MVTYKVYVFRHGKTDYNEKGKFTGWKDSKLTKSGIEDAKKVAKKLKNKNIGIAIHTKLSRSKQTLKEVLKFHPECKILIEDNRMIERSYGDLEGTTHDSFISKIGKKELKLLEEGDAIGDLDPKTRKQVEKKLGTEVYDLIHRGYKIPPPNGESFADVEKRVKLFIKDLKKLIKKEKKNVMISAHGNSIRLFRKIMEKADQKESTTWFIPYDKVYEYEFKI